MEDLRSWHEVPGIAHFCSLFRTAFDLTDFDIEDLEDGLIASGSEEGSPFLFELISRMLCGCYGRTDIYYYNFEVYLKDILKHRYELEAGKTSPLEEPESTFRTLDLYTKVQVLNKLCDFRLDAEDVAEQLKGYEGDNMRLEPLGKDSVGATYWYFYGVRLYKEDPEPEPPKDETKPKPTKKQKGKKDKQKKSKKNKSGKKKENKEKRNASIRRSCRISQKANEDEDSGSDDESINDEEPEQPVEELEEKTIIVKPTAGPARWHLICTTLEDWENLASTFKNSKVKCEKNLYKVIEESFLPEIPNILESRERERKKRLLEMAPRRASNRLESKRKEQEEQDKILAEAQEIEDKQRAEFEEERRKQQEAERLEQERRDREERQKAREERANRLVMREERARLIAEGKEIPPELLYFGNSRDRDDASEKSELDDDTYASMLKVVEAVRAHKDAWPFWDPVDNNDAPGYSDTIKKPMDLSTIEKKIHERRYVSRNKFMSDFRLIFHNCRRYNGPSSTLASMAANVEHFYRKSLKKLLPVEEYDSDEDFKVSLGDTRKRGRMEQKFRPKRAASSRAMEHLHDAFDDDLFDSSLHGRSSSDDNSNSSTSYEKPAKKYKMDDNIESKIMEALVATKRAQAAAEKVRRFRVSESDESGSTKMPVLLSHGTLLKNAEKRPISWIIDGKKIPVDGQEKEILSERFTKKISTTGTFAALLEKNRQMQNAQKNTPSPIQSPGLRKSIIVIKKSGEKSVIVSPNTEGGGLSHFLAKHQQSGGSVNISQPSESTPLKAPVSMTQAGVTVPKVDNASANESLVRGRLQCVTMSPTGQKIITVMAPAAGQQTAQPSLSHTIKTTARQGNNIQVIDGKLVIGGKATGIPVSGSTKIVYKGAAPAENPRIPVPAATSAKKMNPSIVTKVENLSSIGGFLNTQLETLGNQIHSVMNSDELVSSNFKTVRNEMDTNIPAVSSTIDTAVPSDCPVVTSSIVSNIPVNSGVHVSNNRAISITVSNNQPVHTPSSVSHGNEIHGSSLLNTPGYNNVPLIQDKQKDLLEQPGGTGLSIQQKRDNNNHKEYSVESNQTLRSEKCTSVRNEQCNIMPIVQNSASVYDRIVDLPTSVEVIDQNNVNGPVIGQLDLNNSVLFSKPDISPTNTCENVDQHSNRKRKNIFESFSPEKSPAPPTKMLRPTLNLNAPHMNISKTSPTQEIGSVTLPNISQPSIWNMETKKFIKPTDILNSLSTKLGNKSNMSGNLFPKYKSDVENTAGLSTPNVNGSNTAIEHGTGSPTIITIHKKNSAYTES